MTDLILKQELNVYGNISSSEKTVICKGCGAVLSEDLKCRYCSNEYIDKNNNSADKHKAYNFWDVLTYQATNNYKTYGVTCGDIFDETLLNDKHIVLSYKGVIPHSLLLALDGYIIARDNGRGEIHSYSQDKSLKIDAKIDYNTGDVTFNTLAKCKSLKITYTIKEK